MAQERCAKCGGLRDTRRAGAARCSRCGFICSDCAYGRKNQCPKCEEWTLRK